MQVLRKANASSALQIRKTMRHSKNPLWRKDGSATVVYAVAEDSDNKTPNISFCFPATNDPVKIVMWPQTFNTCMWRKMITF